jgi:uncharacterized membrane protein
MNRALLLIHLLAVVIWIGGMFFAQFCLRPVAAAQLPPPQRLPLVGAILQRFFGFVGVALLLLWGSGIVLFGQIGSVIPLNVGTMMVIGALMTIVFGGIIVRFNQMQAPLANENWPAVAQAMGAIQKLVAVNLVLGFINIAVAVLGPSVM